MEAIWKILTPFLTERGYTLWPHQCFFMTAESENGVVPNGYMYSTPFRALRETPGSIPNVLTYEYRVSSSPVVGVLRAFYRALTLNFTECPHPSSSCVRRTRRGLQGVGNWRRRKGTRGPPQDVRHRDIRPYQCKSHSAAAGSDRTRRHYVCSFS